MAGPALSRLPGCSRLAEAIHRALGQWTGLTIDMPMQWNFGPG